MAGVLARRALVLVLASGWPQFVAPAAPQRVVIRNSNDVPAGGVACTAVTMSEIPDLSGAVTKTAAVSGNWSSGATWSGGVVPGASDRVCIATGLTVTYDVDSTTTIPYLGVHGALQFSEAVARRIRVGTLQVFSDGALRIGSTADPFCGVTADVEFNGAPDTSADPKQFGIGLLVDGELTVNGCVKTPFVRLAEEVSAAETVLDLASTPSGWNNTDEYAFPDSRFRSPFASGADGTDHNNNGVGFVTENERKAGSTISGTTLTLAAGATYAHPGGYTATGTLEILPHVANLTRSVQFSTLAGSTARGHSMFHHMATVDVRYASFINMGRTTTLDLDCVQFTTGVLTDDSDCVEGTGAKTHDGTNQKGRYPIHFHKFMGPANASDVGFQATFLGNVIDMPLKWPLTIHDSSYLHIKDNVIFNTTNATGAGIMSEEGYEFYNMLDGNLVIGARGQTYDGSGTLLAGCANNCSDPREQGGREGACVYFRSFYNYFRNNVCAGAYGDTQQIANSVGYKFGNSTTLTHGGAVNSTGTDRTVSRPDFRGADVTNAAESTDVIISALPILEFSYNEAYGAMSDGMTSWFHQSDSTGPPDGARGTQWSIVDHFTTWNINEYGFFAYPLARYRFDHYKVRGPYNSLGRGYLAGFVNGDYATNDVIFYQPDIQNVAACLANSVAASGRWEVNNLLCRGDIGVQRMGFSGFTNGTEPWTPATWTFDAVDWAGISGNAETLVAINAACGVGLTDRAFLFEWNYGGAAVVGQTSGACFHDNGEAAAISTTLTRSGATVTATTSSAHNSVTNRWRTVLGAVQTEYNGTFQITVTDSTHFTYQVTGTPATPATGTIESFDTNDRPHLSTTYTARHYGATPQQFRIYFPQQETYAVNGDAALGSCDDTTYTEIFGCVGAITSDALASLPLGAVGNYMFSETTGGSTPNRVTDVDALSNLTIHHSDYSVSGDGIDLNPTITFTHSADWPGEAEPAGTYLTATNFPNTFAGGGTIGIRLKLAASYYSGVGQASYIGILDVRPYPEINELSNPPYGIVFYRGAASAPLQVHVRSGMINYPALNANVGDTFESSEITDPSAAFVNLMLVWTPLTETIYANGSVVGTLTRTSINPPTMTNFYMFVGVNPWAEHSDDRSFFKGILHRLVIYDHTLTAAELTALNTALSE